MNAWIEIEAQKERQKDWLRAVERQRVVDVVSAQEGHARRRYGRALVEIVQWGIARMTGRQARSMAKGKGTLAVVARANVSRS